jgi:membrane protease YdiL (CAAX protease family)
VGHAIAALMMGLFLAEVALRTGSLYVTIAAHVANNAFATLWPENDLRDGATGLLLGGSVLVLGVVLVIFAQRHPRRSWLTPPR